MEAGAAEAGAAAAAPANSGADPPRRNRSKHAARAAEDAVTSQGGDAGTFMLWLADRARGNPRRKAQLSRFQSQARWRSVKPPTRLLIEALAEECPNVGVDAAEAWVQAYAAAWGRRPQAPRAEEEEEQLSQADAVEEQLPQVDGGLGGGGLSACDGCATHRAARGGHSVPEGARSFGFGARGENEERERDSGESSKISRRI
jgi:hypothetical protein